MSFTDRYGLPLTTTSARAAELYSRGLDHSLAAEAPAEACFREAREEDPGFALAHIGEARLLQFRGKGAEAMAASKRAEDLATSATTREQSHIACIATAIAGDSPGALAAVHAHIADYPRDAFVLSQACGVYGLIGFSGRLERNEEQLALLEPLSGAYGEDWWFLSQLAFSYNELFRHEEARAATERSLALYGRNGHASHTMAHVQYETGEAEAGAAFLRNWLIGFDPANQLYGHNHWHLALFELAAGNLDRVLELYDQVIRPDVSTSTALGCVADAASLLWRCSLTEQEAAELPWASVSDWATRSFPRAGMTWADAHCMLAWAATNNGERLGVLIDELKERVDAGKVYAGPMLPALGESYLAFANRDWARAADGFDRLQPEFIRLGGSHAQRDVFEETRIEANVRAGRLEVARDLLETRLDRRPNGRDSRWLERITRDYAEAAGG
jgi:tetratricopeptide (TPR) repeat protein